MGGFLLYGLHFAAFRVHHYKSLGPIPLVWSRGGLCTARIQSVKVSLCEYADCFAHINKAIVLEVRAFHFML